MQAQVNESGLGGHERQPTQPRAHAKGPFIVKNILKELRIILIFLHLLESAFGGFL